MLDKQKYIEQFKKLYKEKNKKDITDAKALEHFEKLTTLVRAIYKPIPKSALENGQCPSCLRKVKTRKLKNNKSKKEFLISGLCQNCQDKTFKKYA